MPRPRKPSRDLDSSSFAVSSFRFSADDRASLIRLAKLENNNERSESFVRDVEQVVADYHQWENSRKRCPSPASQKALFSEIRKVATRLQELLVNMDPDTRDVYHRSAPFIYEGVWQDHRITIDHIINVAERADRTLSQRARPGRKKNTALEDLFPNLHFTVRKYFPSLGRQAFGELVQIVCEGAGITIPDGSHSPSRFWVLVDPPFPPKA
jgi:hypothetical protein